MAYLYPFFHSLVLPVLPLLAVAFFSTFLEKKLPFGSEDVNAGPKIFWGEVFFRFLWGLFFFDLVPAWLYFQFRPQVFSSIWAGAFVLSTLITLLGFIPLVVLLETRFTFNWGYLFFTLLWIFIGLTLSLAAMQLAY